MRKNEEFTLDRHGGRDKITKAMYSPQTYRRENTAWRRKKQWRISGAIVIGCIIVYLLAMYR